MRLSELLDVDKLFKEVADNNISMRPHPKFRNLYILKYTEHAAYTNVWTHEQCVSRGLIIENFRNEWYVIGRGWPKFFNIGQPHAAHIDYHEKVVVSDKKDGSCSILYRRPDGDMAIATLGSFASTQAEHATQIWNEKYSHIKVRNYITYMFEIVYSANRIVLDYGNMDDLILLGAITNSGKILSPREAVHSLDGQWTGPVTEVLEYDTFEEAINAPSRDNKEGVVIQAGNRMVKMKEKDYLLIHKLRFELTPKRVWENLSQGVDIEAMIKPLPDEFRLEVEELALDFNHLFADTYTNLYHAYKAIDQTMSRKDIAISIKDHDHKFGLFLMLDNKPVDHYIWKYIEPKETL